MSGFGLRLHHIGCLVANMAEAAAGWGCGPLAAPLGEPIRIASQRVQVAFAEAGGGVLLEFVVPDADNKFLKRMLDKGTTFYHLGYLCADMQGADADFIASGARELSRFHSEAFEGRECVFYLTAMGQMIELIESEAGAGK